MRYLDSSRPLKISLTISILLHVCLFIFLYYYHPDSFKKVENLPISVEYLPPPKEGPKALKPPEAFKIGPVAKIKKGKPGALVPKDIPPARPQAKPLAGSTPAAPGGTAKTPEPHPVEVPAQPSLPGIKDLTPSLEQLTKAGEERGEGGGGGQDEETVALESTDFTYTSYLHGVKFKIEGVWRYPEAAKKSALQGRGLVSFTIHRDGTISDIKILSSSGYQILDDALIKAVKAAAPFNPMTENIRVKRLNVVATFEYNLIIPGRIWSR